MFYSVRFGPKTERHAVYTNKIKNVMQYEYPEHSRSIEGPIVIWFNVLPRVAQLPTITANGHRLTGSPIPGRVSAFLLEHPWRLLLCLLLFQPIISAPTESPIHVRNVCSLFALSASLAIRNTLRKQPISVKAKSSYPLQYPALPVVIFLIFLLIFRKTLISLFSTFFIFSVTKRSSVW